VAPLVVVVVAVLVGSAVAAPVVASAADVDPDHPLYPLKRVGERIRGLDNVEQMKLRWQEYQRMAEKGKGLQYRHILQEFVDKLKALSPSDVKDRWELVRWMQEQMPGIGEVRLKLAEQACQGDAVCENWIEQMRIRWRGENLENLNAEMLRLRERMGARAPEQYLRAENLLRQACLKIESLLSTSPLP